jgi:hypothetical protein
MAVAAVSQDRRSSLVAGVGPGCGPGRGRSGVEAVAELAPPLSHQFGGVSCDLVVGRVAGWDGPGRSAPAGGLAVFGEHAQPPVQHRGGRVGVTERS